MPLGDVDKMPPGPSGFPPASAGSLQNRPPQHLAAYMVARGLDALAPSSIASDSEASIPCFLYSRAMDGFRELSSGAAFDRRTVGSQ